MDIPKDVDGQARFDGTSEPIKEPKKKPKPPPCRNFKKVRQFNLYNGCDTRVDSVSEYEGDEFIKTTIEKRRGK